MNEEEESVRVIVADVRARLGAVERDVGYMRRALDAQNTNKPQWPAVLAAAAAVGALIVTLAMNL